MSLGKFFVVVAVVAAPLAGYEYYARYQSWEKIKGLEHALRSTATVGKPRSAVEAGLSGLGIKHAYSDKTHAIYGRDVVGRFIFYSTEYSFVIRFGSDDAVVAVDSNVFHEGL